MNTLSMAVSGKKPLSRRQVVVATAFGNFLEFFDFSVFATFAVIIGSLFFPSEEGGAADLLKALATFGVGFVMRPVGGVIIGHYADRKGRRPAMILTLSLMTLGTLMIACAPTYSQAGVWGAIVLVSARLLQGFAAGGEVGASTSMLVESAPANRRGLYSSWQIATQGAATMVGGLLATALFAWLSKEQMAAWGWRLPFLIGALLGPVGLMLRLRIEDAVHFSQPKAPTQAAGAPQAVAPSKFRLVAQYYKTILVGVLLTIGGTIVIYISLYFYANLGAKFLQIPQKYTSMAIMLAGFLNAVFSPLAGYLSDLYGRKPIVLYTRWALTLLALPSFWLLTVYPAPWALFTVVFVIVTLATLSGAPAILIISEFFPREIRALGFSIVYSVGVAIFGGFAQYFATELIVRTGSTLSPSLYMIVGCLVSIFALRYVEDQYRVELK